MPVSEKNQIRNCSQFSEAEGTMAYLSLLLLSVNLELLSNSMRGSRLRTGSGSMILGYHFKSSHCSEDSSDIKQTEEGRSGVTGGRRDRARRLAGRRAAQRLEEDLITTVCHSHSTRLSSLHLVSHPK